MSRKQRSKLGYWIAGVVVLLGAGGGITWGTIAYFDFKERYQELDRTTLPGRLELRLAADEDQVVYFEGTDSVNAPALDVTVEGPDGSVPVESYDVNLEYDAPGGGTGKAIATFNAPVTGDYEVIVEAPVELVGSFAVGQSITDSLLPYLIGASVVVLAGIGLGILIVALTSGRRFEKIRRLRRVGVRDAEP